jgi:hypothetical protein
MNLWHQICLIVEWHLAAAWPRNAKFALWRSKILRTITVSPRSGDTSGALRRVSGGGACGCSAGENLEVFRPLKPQN